MNNLAYLEAGGAFLLAAVWSLLLMPGAITLGKRKGLVSRPRLFGRSRRRTITYLGGLTLAATAAMGLSLSGAMARETVVILGGATVLLLLGLADDRMGEGGLSPRARILVEMAVAAVAWLGGLQVELFGVEWADGLVTIIFLVALVNAFNLLDNMDGVAGATATTLSVGLLALALSGGQQRVAILAAAVAGASLGFLRHNLLRARVYLGNGGALFIGFLLGAVALKLQLPFEPPLGFVALIAIFAVPATDTSLVILSRFLHGRRIFEGGTDHVSHRLVGLGIRPAGAAALHALGSAVAASGVFLSAGNDRAELLAVVVGAFAAMGLGFVPQSIYGEKMRWRRPAILLGATVAAGVAIGPGLALAVSARSDLDVARAQLLSAEQALEGLEVERAESLLQVAETALSRAQRRLSSPAALPARLIPVVGGNIKVGRALAESGLQLVVAGRDAILVLRTLPIEDGQIVAPWKDGRLDIEAFFAAREPAERMQRRVSEAYSIVNRTNGVLLLPPVRTARESALVTLGKAQRKVDAAAGASYLLPEFFGVDGKRTWFLAAENTAELRGRGGYIGAFGILEASDGNLDLVEVRPTTSLPKLRTSLLLPDAPEEYVRHYRRVGGLAAWPNLNASPQFASGARLWLRGLERQAGIKANGMVSMDPAGLSMLLEATGPVTVKGIPEPITSENADEWALNRAYLEFEHQVRKERLADIAEAAWGKVTSGQDIDPAKLGRALGRMISGRHLVVFSSNTQEQKVVERLGIGGGVDRVLGDYLMIVSNNLGENKIDFYQTRRIKYRGVVGPGGWLEAKLEILITNNVPYGGRIPGIIAGKNPALALDEGRSRSYLTVFVPQDSQLEEVQADGKPTSNFDNLTEFGHRVFATHVELGPGESRRLEFRYRVPNVIAHGRYMLKVQNQATVHPDHVSIEVTVPSSAAVGLRAGFAPTGSLRWEGPLTQGMDLEAGVALPLQSRILARLGEMLRSPVIAFGR